MNRLLDESHDYTGAVAFFFCAFLASNVSCDTQQGIAIDDASSE